MKHSQGQKVKGHKVMQRSSTKTSNIQKTSLGSENASVF